MENQDLSAVETTDIPQIKRILPLPQAISTLSPGRAWSLTGDNVSGLNWQDDPAFRPSDAAIIEKAEEIFAQLPFKILRKQRDARMREVDWVTLRSMRTGDPIPNEWKEYMQSLADITETSEPKLVNGLLIGVNWPNRPDGKPAGQPPGYES